MATGAAAGVDNIERSLTACTKRDGECRNAAFGQAKARSEGAGRPEQLAVRRNATDAGVPAMRGEERGSGREPLLPEWNQGSYRRSTTDGTAASSERARRTDVVRAMKTSCHPELFQRRNNHARAPTV